MQGAADPAFRRDIRAATDALSVQAEAAMLCIPDRADMDEERQQRVLQALSGARRPAVTLLWRSVAIVLDALDSGTLAAAPGMRVACLIHASDGWEVQRLVIRSLPEHPGWMAPERGSIGATFWPEAGLDRLRRHAEGAVAAANPQLLSWSTDHPRLALELLLAEPEPDCEILRRDTGPWIRLRPPPDFRLPDPGGTRFPDMPDCDRVLVATPLAARHAAWLDQCFAGWKTRPQVVGPQAAARGALLAARRIERGIPHYLDRLDQIALVVLRDGEPAFRDLIPADATVPGNREYVSDPITSLVWSADMASVQFYIRKGEREVRRWNTPELPLPRSDQRLEMRLRQMPAQGWAKLLLTSPDWETLRRDPIRLDWATLEQDKRSAEQILEDLKGPRPVVPERVHHRADIGMWDGSRINPSLAHVVRHVNVADSSSLRKLADALTRGYRLGPGRLVFAVGTDGELPAELDPQIRAEFDRTIARIADRLMSELNSDRGPSDNQGLRCLTWINACCPPEIRAAMVDALTFQDAGKSSRLFRPAAAARVVFQGLGRTVTDTQTLRRLIPRLAADLSRLDALAALSSLLSRPAATPDVLASLHVPRLAGQLANHLLQLAGENRFGVHLKYALLAIAGLLRVRERDPYALMADRSEPALRLLEAVKALRDRMHGRSRAIPAYAFKIEAVNTLIEFLSGTGGRPDILTWMESEAPAEDEE